MEKLSEAIQKNRRTAQCPECHRSFIIDIEIPRNSLIGCPYHCTSVLVITEPLKPAAKLWPPKLEMR